jgi:SAM-dependent methyltransferase
MNASAEIRKTATTSQVCPSCFSGRLDIFHEIRSVPVNSVLNFKTRESALRYKRGDILLGFCEDCGFITNLAFDPALIEYSSDCEESQGFSPTFNTFAKGLAKYLVEKYLLYNKEVLEIGCGKGEFLGLLCDAGNNRGIGFDPAYVAGRVETKSGSGIRFIKDFYSDKYLDYCGDLVCCRMTLEHILHTRLFVETVRRSVRDGAETIAFFQVPDVTRILHDCAFEDIYYEHCSYFSPGSIARLFRSLDFDILDLTTGYDRQYILLEAKAGLKDGAAPLPLENDLRVLRTYVSAFRDGYSKKLDSWLARLEEIKASGKRAVIWGSGSKGVSFLTTLNVYDQIEYVVDVNPHRQGGYMAGTGQLIVAPEFLAKYKPDVVIIMNAIYREEIEQQIRQIGITPEIASLGQ